MCGEDYRFGKKGAGKAALLRQLAEPLGITVTALAPITWEKEPVSSSRIRRCLAEGNTELAGTLLGVPYSICGRATRQGDELALRWPEEMARPADGSYRGRDEGRPVLLTVRDGAVFWQGEESNGEPVRLEFLGRAENTPH